MMDELMKDKSLYLGKLMISLVFITGLVLAACTGGGPDKAQDVRNRLVEQVSEKTLPDSYSDTGRRIERKAYYEMWGGIPLLFSTVSYSQTTGTYEVKFADPELDRKEAWGIDMKSGTVWPLDAGALFSALFLFCEGPDDPSTECQELSTKLYLSD